MAAIALYDALARLVDPTRLSLKWPNDVLLDGGKVAGILLESEADGANVKWLAVGVGVNLSFAPDPDGEGTSTPVSLTDTVNVADFHALLAEAYSLEETRIVELGFGPVRERWMQRAARLGQEITARSPKETIIGTFRAVDETGSLQLDTPKGRRVIHAADVFFE